MAGETITSPAGQGYRRMSKQCDLCDKKSVTGNTISHSHRKTRRVWQPNLKKIKVLEGGVKKVKRVCTRCIRSGKVDKAF